MRSFVLGIFGIVFFYNSYQFTNGREDSRLTINWKQSLNDRACPFFITLRDKVSCLNYSFRFGSWGRILLWVWNRLTCFVEEVSLWGLPWLDFSHFSAFFLTANFHPYFTSLAEHRSHWLEQDANSWPLRYLYCTETCWTKTFFPGENSVTSAFQAGEYSQRFKFCLSGESEFVVLEQGR